MGNEMGMEESGVEESGREWRIAAGVEESGSSIYSGSAVVCQMGNMFSMWIEGYSLAAVACVA